MVPRRLEPLLLIAFATGLVVLVVALVTPDQTGPARSIAVPPIAAVTGRPAAPVAAAPGRGKAPTPDTGHGSAPAGIVAAVPDNTAAQLSTSATVPAAATADAATSVRSVAARPTTAAPLLALPTPAALIDTPDQLAASSAASSPAAMPEAAPADPPDLPASSTPASTQAAPTPTPLNNAYGLDDPCLVQHPNWLLRQPCQSGHS
jgi:hypothetical protein